MSTDTIPATRAPGAPIDPATDATHRRSHALAERLEQGARSLIALASTLTDEEWRSRVADGRRIGVLVHHVAGIRAALTRQPLPPLSDSDRER